MRTRYHDIQDEVTMPSCSAAMGICADAFLCPLLTHSHPQPDSISLRFAIDRGRRSLRPPRRLSQLPSRALLPPPPLPRIVGPRCIKRRSRSDDLCCSRMSCVSSIETIALPALHQRKAESRTGPNSNAPHSIPHAVTFSAKAITFSAKAHLSQ
jgi:hypothetical protein